MQGRQRLSRTNPGKDTENEQNFRRRTPGIVQPMPDRKVGVFFELQNMVDSNGVAFRFCRLAYGVTRGQGGIKSWWKTRTDSEKKRQLTSQVRQV